LDQAYCPSALQGDTMQRQAARGADKEDKGGMERVTLRVKAGQHLIDGKMMNAKFSVALCLVFLIHIATCTFSLYIVSKRYVIFDINYDSNSRQSAIFGVVISALLISTLFARANFTFGYFAGLYLSTSILGFVWLSYFSEFPYDHKAARISAIASLISFLIPALWSQPLLKWSSLPSRTFEWIPALILAVSAVVLAWALFYGVVFVSIDNASNMRHSLPALPMLLQYAIGIVIGALLPFAFACYFFRRKWVLAGGIFCLIVCFYPVTLSKIVLLAPFLMAFFCLLGRALEARLATIMSLAIPTLFGLVAFVIFDQILPFGLINLRLNAVPASALDHYNDFFSSHDITRFCQISFVKRIFGCIYTEQLSVVMEKAYHLGNYNASLFSTEGLASSGLYFAPISTFFCGLVVAFGNLTSGKLPPTFILVSGAVLVITLLNVPLSTALLSNGGAFLFLLWYLTPAEYFSKL